MVERTMTTLRLCDRCGSDDANQDWVEFNAKIGIGNIGMHQFRLCPECLTLAWLAWKRLIGECQGENTVDYPCPKCEGK
jgi:hypothetical protein